MQPLDWLTLVGKTVTTVSDDLGMNLVTVWRHFHGKRTPSPEDITSYAEYTKGAVTADDWVELAMRAKADETPDAADQAAATG